MSKATSLKLAAATLVKHDLAVAQLLRSDRDWLWLVGDYKEKPKTRSVLKDTGFRFSRKGHELESGETANWYFSMKISNRTKVKAKRAVVKATEATKAAVVRAKVDPSLLASDNPADEFEKLFG